MDIHDIALVVVGGVVFHCLNRGNTRQRVFGKNGDDAAFEMVMFEVLMLAPMRQLAYCLTPNHWRLLLWPPEGGDLG
jgi:putative transposase